MIFLTRREFSKRLMLSVSTVSRGIKNGEWPFSEYVKIGKSIRYPESLLKKIEELSSKQGSIDDRKL
jgi:predicted DNA-binding transcriptional regulator AlpA